MSLSVVVGAGVLAFSFTLHSCFIGIIGCYNGLNATGGADGVGKATTNTVVISSFSVIISDFFLTKFFLIF